MQRSAKVNCGEPHVGNAGFDDWMPFLFKSRFAAANEENGNYIVTAFLQMPVPTGLYQPRFTATDFVSV